LRGWGRVLWSGVNQHSLCGVALQIAKIYRSRSQVVEMRVVHYCPSDSLQKFLLCVSVIISSTGLEVFVPKGEMLLPGGNDSIELQVKTVKKLHVDIQRS
jgi:hypothetical protein